MIVPRVRFSVIGLNHNHIYGQVNTLLRAGAELVSVFAREMELIEEFRRKFPQARVAASELEILEDETVHLITSAAINSERGPLGIQVMRHRKDFLCDKPAFTTLAQLEETRQVQADTQRIFSIYFSERFAHRATVKAGELVRAGTIGRVLQTIGLGPHRASIMTRPSWFFKKAHYGGILTDIASHQFDQFLFFTGSTSAEIVSAQVANYHFPQYPEFEDFGDCMVRGNQGTGYLRVDWLTPDGLKTWGDGRLTILGSEGFIEIRKNCDLAGREGGDHLFLVDQKRTIHWDCRLEPLPFGTQLLQDIMHRTQTAQNQAQAFLASQLALEAQMQAVRLV